MFSFIASVVGGLLQNTCSLRWPHINKSGGLSQAIVVAADSWKSLDP
jgi:hypothetical protein